MLTGMWRYLFTDPVDWQLAAFIVVPTLLVAWLAARAVRRAAAVAMAYLLRDTLATTSPLVRAPLRLIGLAAFVLIFVVLVFPGQALLGGAIVVVSLIVCLVIALFNRPRFLVPPQLRAQRGLVAESRSQA